MGVSHSKRHWGKRNPRNADGPEGGRLWDSGHNLASTWLRIPLSATGFCTSSTHAHYYVIYLITYFKVWEEGNKTGQDFGVEMQANHFLVSGGLDGRKGRSGRDFIKFYCPCAGRLTRLAAPVFPHLQTPGSSARL